MTYLAELKDWLQKGGDWKHEHDGFPKHPVSVKQHQLYFMKHPELLHQPAQTEEPVPGSLSVADLKQLKVGDIIQEKTTGVEYKINYLGPNAWMLEDVKTGVKHGVVSSGNPNKVIHNFKKPSGEGKKKLEEEGKGADVNDLDIGTFIEAQKYNSSISGKITKIYHDAKGNKKYTISFPGGPVNLYPAEIDKGSSPYYALTGIKVSSPGSKEEAEHHEKHSKTDYDNLPEGTKVEFEYTSTNVVAIGEITGKTSVGTYTVDFGSGQHSAVDPHELKQGYFGGGGGKVNVHLVDEPKDLPQKQEEQHPLKPGDKITSADQLQVGDIISYGNLNKQEYEVLGIDTFNSENFVSVKKTDTKAEYLGQQGIKEGYLQAYKFVSSHADKLSPKKLLPGTNLSSADVKDLQVGDVLKYGDSGNVYTITSIDPESDTWTLKNQEGVEFSKQDCGDVSKQIGSYVFQHHGDHQEKDHQIPNKKLQHLSVGDVIASPDGAKFTVMSPVVNGISDIKSHQTGITSSYNFEHPSAPEFKLVSQKPKHNMNDLPIGTTIEYDHPGYGEPVKAKIISTTPQGHPIIEVYDSEGEKVSSGIALSHGELNQDSLFGYKIVDVQVPEKPKIVPGVNLEAFEKEDLQNLIGSKVSSTLGSKGTIVDISKDQVYVLWASESHIGFTSAYSTDQAQKLWKIAEPGTVLAQNLEALKYGKGEIKYGNFGAELNLGQALAANKIGDETFYKFDLNGQLVWVSETGLDAKGAAAKLGATPDFAKLKVGDKITYNFGSGGSTIKEINSGGTYEVLQNDGNVTHEVTAKDLQGLYGMYAGKYIPAPAELPKSAIKLKPGDSITPDNFVSLQQGDLLWSDSGDWNQAKVISVDPPLGTLVIETQYGNTEDLLATDLQGVSYSLTQIEVGSSITPDSFKWVPIGTKMQTPNGEDFVQSVSSSGITFQQNGLIDYNDFDDGQTIILELPGQSKVQQAVESMGIKPESSSQPKTADNLVVGDKLKFDDDSYLTIEEVNSNGSYEVTLQDGYHTMLTPKDVKSYIDGGAKIEQKAVPTASIGKNAYNLEVGDKLDISGFMHTITAVSPLKSSYEITQDSNGYKSNVDTDMVNSWVTQSGVQIHPKQNKVDFTKLKVGDSFVSDVGITWTVMSSLDSKGQYSLKAADGGEIKATPEIIENWTVKTNDQVQSANAVTKIKKTFKTTAIDFHHLEKGTQFKIGQDGHAWKIVKTWKLPSQGGYNYTLSDLQTGSQVKYSSHQFEGLAKKGHFHSFEVYPKPGYDPKPFIDINDFEVEVGDLFNLPSGSTWTVSQAMANGNFEVKQKEVDGSDGYTMYWSKGAILGKINEGHWKISEENMSVPAPEKTLDNLEPGDKVEVGGIKYKIESGDAVSGYVLVSPSGHKYPAYTKEKLADIKELTIIPMSSTESLKQQPVSTYSPPDINGQVHEKVNWDERLEKVGGKLGYNEGGKFKDKVSGSEFYVKFPQSDEHAEIEQLATNLYRLASVKVAQASLIDFQGKKAIIVSWLPNSKDLTPAEAGQKGTSLRPNFAVDAWLANWDVAGGYNSNNIVESNGELYRIDPGGAFHFKGSGGLKPFGPEVKELESMKNASIAPMASKIFAATTTDELKFGANKVMGITDKHIQDAVNATSLPTSKKNELISTLISRRNDVVQKVLGYQYDPATKTYKHAPKKVPSYQQKPTPPQIQKMVYELGSASKVNVLDGIRSLKNEKHIALLDAALNFDWEGDVHDVANKIQKFGELNNVSVSTIRGFLNDWQSGGSHGQAHVRGAFNELLGLWDQHYADEHEFFTMMKEKDHLLTDEAFDELYKNGKLHSHEAIPYIIASHANLRKKGPLVTVYRGISGATVRGHVKKAYDKASEKAKIAMPNDGASGWSLTKKEAESRAGNGVLFKKTVPVEDVLVFFNTWSTSFMGERELIIQSSATRFFSKGEIEFH